MWGGLYSHDLKPWIHCLGPGDVIMVPMDVIVWEFNNVTLNRSKTSTNH